MNIRELYYENEHSSMSVKIVELVGDKNILDTAINCLIDKREIYDFINDYVEYNYVFFKTKDTFQSTIDEIVYYLFKRDESFENIKNWKEVVYYDFFPKKDDFI